VITECQFTTYFYLINIEVIFVSEDTTDKEIQDAKKLISECNFKEFVKMYSNDSDLIKVLGSVFHNDKSRAMWLLLSNTKKEYYLKEMAVIIENDENPRLPNYEYHIAIMVKAGIVLVRDKLHNKHKTKFYRAASLVMLASPYLYEKASKSKTLKNTLMKVFKFASIGIAAFGIHSFLQLTESTFTLGIIPNFIVPLAVIVCGLIGDRIYSYFKNKKKLKQFISFFNL